MIIRDFLPDDRTEFLQMCSDFYSGDAVAHAVNPIHFTRTFDQLMEKNHFIRGLAVEHDGAIAGYCQLSFTWSNEAGGLTVWIEELYVREKYRSRGLGSEFFEFVQREIPVARYRLEVEPENERAIALYRRKGFEVLPYGQMVKDIEQ